LKTELAHTRRRPAACLLVAALPALLAFGAAGCRNDMREQNKVSPYEESRFFADHSSARPLPAHTVARGEARLDETFYTGLRGNQPVNELPYPVTRDLLLRGRERYDIFCSPCHDRSGGGRGMIVQRGYKQPPAYTEDRLRNAPVGYFFSVISLGYGVMPSYAAQIPVADRWAIAAYIRVLQYRQGARLADLPPAARQGVEADLAGHSQAAPGAAAQQPKSSEVP
jgi:cytochrome c553